VRRGTPERALTLRFRCVQGFDPIGFSSDPKVKADLQMKELANGRLAMFGFGGIVTQSVLTGNSFPYLFGDATTFGSGGDFAWNVVP
jgi:hypothetical protein